MSCTQESVDLCRLCKNNSYHKSQHQPTEDIGLSHIIEHSIIITFGAVIITAVLINRETAVSKILDLHVITTTPLASPVNICAILGSGKVYAFLHIVLELKSINTF